MPLDHPIDFLRRDDGENIGVNPTCNRTIGEVIDARLSRRGMLRGLAAAAAAGALGSTLLDTTALAQAYGPSSFTFKELAKTLDQTHHIAEGYDAQILIRWGDKLVGEAPAFEVNSLSVAAQEKQFGYNCDFIAYMPLPAGSQSSDNGLLFVNHEYTNSNLMFAGLGAGRDANQKVSKAQAEVELAGHGASVVEVRRTNGQWRVVEGSRYNRRITGMTPMGVSGPAASHEKLKTKADPGGGRILGTLNNCGGGWTPWGTVLTCEENFNGYFGGDVDKQPDAAMYKRYGVTKDSWYGWVKHIDRFDVAKEPNEPNRFGWVVEIDPYDPNAMPVKRTALGRIKHEAATTVVNPDGRVVVYSGDDERFEYVYKFVTNGRYNPNDRAANRNLLDDGTLYVAQFADDGNVKWLPLVHGQGPLNASNGFANQAEVLIYARYAADLLGATKMDRPEDVETNPVTGRTYIMLTNNDRRMAEQVNKANPRAANRHGHIIEIVPPGGRGAQADHAASEAKWSIFLLAGKPGIDAGAMYHRGTTENGWISCPDNCMFDSKGRLWVLTDGANSAASIADAIYAIDTEGPGKGLPKQFFTGPIGAEICASILTPDEQTMFVTVQHPGESSGSTFEKPSTRWPDFADGMPPRPSVVVVTKRGGGVIGT
jgi:hypothetical protein